MDRRTFTKTCLAYVPGVALMPLVSGCQATQYINGTMEPNGISVLKTDFTYLKNDQPMQRKYIIVKNDSMEFPIYVYRFADDQYAAVLMKCTHQGNELQASGDTLTCSAHGSEFSNKGVVAQGPAERNLRSFNVTTEGDKIFIDLRA